MHITTTSKHHHLGNPDLNPFNKVSFTTSGSATETTYNTECLNEARKANIFRNKWATMPENLTFCILQESDRQACLSAQSDQCLCFSLSGKFYVSTLYIQNFDILSSLCS